MYTLVEVPDCVTYRLLTVGQSGVISNEDEATQQLRSSVVTVHILQHKLGFQRDYRIINSVSGLRWVWDVNLLQLLC